MERNRTVHDSSNKSLFHMLIGVVDECYRCSKRDQGALPQCIPPGSAVLMNQRASCNPYVNHGAGNIYQHFARTSPSFVGKYTTMEHMGMLPWINIGESSTKIA